MNTQYQLRLLSLSLLSIILLLALPSCGTDDGPSRPSTDAGSWTDGARSVGDVHNQILEEFRRLPLEGSVRRRAREAILRRATQDDAAAPGLLPEVRRVLDGPAFDEIERRLEEARSTIQEGHPDPRELAAMLEGWGIPPADAAEIGSIVAHILLFDQLPDTPAKASRSGSERVFYDVLQSSRDFWTEEAALAKITVDSEVIAFDALGALGGLSLGVIGSIIGSAAYSIIWQEAGLPNDDTSGGCAGCH